MFVKGVAANNQQSKIHVLRHALPNSHSAAPFVTKVSDAISDWAFRNSSPEFRFDLEEQTAENGVTYLRVAGIVTPVSIRSKAALKFSSVKSLLSALPYLTGDELPDNSRLREIEKDIERHIQGLRKELENLRKLINDKPAVGSEEDIIAELKLAGTIGGYDFEMARAEGSNSQTAVRKQQSEDMKEMLNSRPAQSRKDMHTRRRAFNESYSRGRWLVKAAEEGTAGTITDLVKKHDVKELNNVFFEITDVSDLLETDGREGLEQTAISFEHYMELLNSREKSDQARLILVSRVPGVSSDEVKKRVFAALDGRIKGLDESALANLIETSVVQDEQVIRRAGLLEDIKIYDGTSRSRIDTEGFIGRIKQLNKLDKLSARIVTNDPYGWKAVKDGQMAELVQILLWATGNYLIDATTKIGETYKFNEVAKQQA